MRVIFISLTYPEKKEGYPLGLLYLIGHARKYFKEYREKDFVFLTTPIENAFNYIQKKIRFSSNENIVFCFSMISTNRFYIKNISQKIKKYYENSIVIIGGIHPTLDKDVLKHCSAIDIAVEGEGEDTFLEIMQSLSRDFSLATMDSVLGVSYRHQQKIIHNMPRLRIIDIDKIPFPAWDKYDLLEEIISGVNPTLAILTSRGCPYKCVFCITASFWGNVVTYRSIDNIFQEIYTLCFSFKIKGFYINDETFTLSRERIISFCNKMISSGLKLFWSCTIRANTVDNELLMRMHAAGCRTVFMGVESGCQKLIDKSVHKEILLSDVERLVACSKKLGLNMLCSFSYSYPQETLANVLETFKFIERLGLPRPDSSLMSWLWLYPGTPLFEYARTYNKLPKNFHWFKYYSIYNSVFYSNKVPHFIDKLSRRDVCRVMSMLSLPQEKLSAGGMQIFFKIKYWPDVIMLIGILYYRWRNSFSRKNSV